MIPYKQISENLTTKEFNGIVSLLRNNVNFNENIHIRNSTVAGEFGSYQFDFNDATIVDNGVLITNETLSTIGTVKLVNPVFPHSNYFIDLKVYSTEEIHIGDFGDNDEGILVTELTVPLKKDVEVNIPFETLNMNNIVGFDAVVRINHKDLVINTGDNLELSCDYTSSILYIPIPFKIKYFNEDLPVSGKTVSLYEGETLLGTGVTGIDGYATVEVSFNSLGTHTVTAKAGLLSSNSLSLDVIDGMILNVTGSYFGSYSKSPFSYTGKVFVDWGDDTGLVEYTGGKLSHSFTDGESNHTVKVYGNITSLEGDCFAQCTGLTSITVPSSVTSLGRNCFGQCTGLTSITVPSSVTSLGRNCFEGCTGLTSITIPSSVISLGNYCFRYCTGLTSIILNWTSNDILTYQSYWIVDTSSNLKFNIPQGTTNLYTAKGYPSDKLRENIPFDDFTFTERTGKQILSQADGDKAYLDVQLTSEGSPVAVEGVDVEFYKDSTLIDTVQTDSTGKASYEYTSVGAGDIVFEAKTSSLVSKTYSIRDGIFFDVSSSENVSKYGSSSAFSYDNTEQAYYITTSSAKNITRESIVGDFDFEISMDFKATSSNAVFYMGESTSSYECQARVVMPPQYNKGIATYYTNSSQSITGRVNENAYSLDTTKWYHLKVTRIGNVLTAQILDGDTVIATATDNNVTGTTGNVSWHNYVQTGTMYWKNILFIRL